MSSVLFLALVVLPGTHGAHGARPGALSFEPNYVPLVAAPFQAARSVLSASGGLRRSPPPAQATNAGDSLNNGIIIGAIAGALALGTFAGVLCNAMREPGEPSCVGDTLRIAAVGAAIGLGAGIAIDAALTRNAGISVSLGIRF